MCLACNKNNNDCIECKDYTEKINSGECQCKKNYIYNKFTDSCVEKPCDQKLNLCQKCRFNSCEICEENSHKREGQCKCDPGFQYDILSDSCKKIFVINHNCNSKLRLCRECRDNKCLEYKIHAKSAFENKTHGICKEDYSYNPLIDECFSEKCSEKISLCMNCKNEKCLSCKDNSHYITNNNTCICNKGFSEKNDECIKDKKCLNQIKLCQKCENEKCLQCKNYSNYINQNNTCQCIKGFKYDNLKEICVDSI